MADWDVSLVTSMSELFYNKGSFNADISRWDYLERHEHVPDVPRCRGVQPGYRYMGYLERHDHVRDVLPGLRVQSAPIEMGRQLGHDHEDMFYDANAFNKMPEGWDTSKVTDSYNIFYSADAWYARFTGGGATPSPVAGGRARTTRATRPFRPSTAHVGNCTDTLVSGTSCVPTCDPGYVLEGVTSCTDRVLTEAVCTLDVTTRAELKAAVDACVGDRLCE